MLLLQHIVLALMLLINAEFSDYFFKSTARTLAGVDGFRSSRRSFRGCFRNR
jgi:hypothetical protein